MDYKLDLLECINRRWEEWQTQKLQQNELFKQEKAQSGKENETTPHPEDLITAAETFLTLSKNQVAFCAGWVIW